MVIASASGVAVLFLGLAFTLHFLKSAQKTVNWCMLIGGFGVAGVIGMLLARLAGLVVGTTNSGTRLLFGAGVPLLAVLVVGTILVVHMRPGGKGPSRATPWLALAFPSFVAALGGGVAAAMGTVPDEIYAAVSSFLGSL
ncbi:hypothetical protein [Kribbella catacumbae]|uniref:hypothetical protein n=1 Tax=Kribbella catacumbae TaxID=460086 RepID=UPI000360F30D|nr:hypothetical protein [Kribbella catacumbae]